MLSIVRTLEDAKIQCCFVGECALTYYGAGKDQNVSRAINSISLNFLRYPPYDLHSLIQDRYLCVCDVSYDTAVVLLKDMMASVPPSPGRDRDRLWLHHLFARFKFIGATDFWLILPSSFAHVSCESSGIERSLGDLPYTTLKNYVEALLDTQNLVDLEDLVDAADLSKEWGELKS